MKRNLNELYLTNSSGIIGRDLEMQKVFLTLLRHEKPNLILTGDPGVGKTAIVHLLAELIAKELCPKWLIGYQVIEINTNELLAGPGYRGVVEEKFQQVIEQASGKKVILFFDEFHTVTHLGEMANGQTPGLGNTLKTHLTGSSLRVIGATTTEELKTINDKALMRRFTVLNIDEPTNDAMLSICENVFTKYTRGLLECKLDFKEVISMSKTIEGFNPDKLKNLIDISVAKAKIEGKTNVTNIDLEFAYSMLVKNKPVEETIESF